MWNNSAYYLIPYKKYVFVTTFVVQTDHRWCCGLLDRYPDMIPNQKWGACIQESEENKWEIRSCNKVVGGSSADKCRGGKN